jgi:Ni/Fe-hydrogenase b-type cytochrome subunit
VLLVFGIRRRYKIISGSVGKGGDLAVEPLVYRHNRVTRLTHWINTIALTILFMSGLQIFNAFPHLHWGSKAEPEEALVSISATNRHGDVRGYIEFLGYRIDTTGLLGVQLTESGPTARAFPSWITIPGYFWLAGGRRWHFFFGWLFAINGLLYFVYNLLNGHMRKFLFTPRDAAKVPAMMLYYLHLRRESPQDGEYNPLQKMAYTSVFVILTPLVLFSGMAMSPQLDVAFNWLPAMFGGRQSARSVHFILAFGFASFTFGHIFMVLATGMLNNMRSMVTGWYREKVPSHKEPPRAPAPSKLKLEEPPPAEEKRQPVSETTNSAVVQPPNPVTAKPETTDEKTPIGTATNTSTEEGKEAQQDVEK